VLAQTVLALAVLALAVLALAHAVSRAGWADSAVAAR
jgi:hypothetical protein